MFQIDAYPRGLEIHLTVPLDSRETTTRILKTPPTDQKQGISTLTATAVVVANMIGTGVFTSLGFQVAGIPSGFSILLLWFIGGVLALCGALAYGELSAALPRSGGEYHFLSEIYHPAVGFMAGWISATVGFAAPAALAAMAFGKYFQGAFPASSPLLLSLAIIWLTSLIHLSPLRLVSAFQNFSTLLKAATILFVIAAGFCIGHPQAVTFLPVAQDAHLMVTAPFAISLIYVMYSYSGWNASAYIVNEIRDPQRNVPRSIFWGTLFVMALYVALNAVFLRAAPIGDIGSRVMAGFICLGLVSFIGAMTWIGPRVAMVIGEDYRVLDFLAMKSRHGVPIVAVLLQLAVVTTMLAVAGFQAVLDYIQFSLILSSSLTVLGVIVLRIRRPALPRPFKTWGYPVTPLLFLAINGYTMFYLVSSQPRESLAGFITMLAGLAIYFVSSKSSPRVASKTIPISVQDEM
jgi:basic amino acid/polyamine antiporter, APA family